MAPVIDNPFVRLSDRRYSRYIDNGIKLVREGMSFRNAAQEAHVSPSCLHYHYHKAVRETPRRANSRLSLTVKEENLIVDVLLEHSRRGRALCRKDLQDCVEKMVQKFPTHRRESLRFKNGRPRRRFCELFEARHCQRIILKRPSNQDAKRFRATNAKVLVHHMTSIKKIITHHNILPSRIVNVDETGFSPLKENRLGRLRRRYYPRTDKPFAPNPEFQNVNHITVLGTAFADGRLGIPMVIFKGTRLRVRRVTRSRVGEKENQCIAQFLPPNSVVTARKDVASIDSSNFLQWAEHFLKDTEILRSQGPLLMIYDGHRSHLSIPLLEMLSTANVIAYALPAHTSGTTQPLDFGVFPSMKHHFREMLDVVYRSRKRERQTIDKFDVSQIISKSYQKTFTVSNVLSGFRKCGIWPLDDCRLFAQARLYSFEEPNGIATLEEMLDMIDTEQEKSVEHIVEHVHLYSSGMLDTFYEAVLTTDTALSLMWLSEQNRNLSKKKWHESSETAAGARNH